MGLPARRAPSTFWSTFYGGTFVGAAWGALQYTNGTVTATRVDDFGVNNSSLALFGGAPGQANDQAWHDGTTLAVARARYARYTQEFGWNRLSDLGGGNYALNGGFNSLFTVDANANNMINPPQSTTGPFHLSSLFAFARRGNGPGSPQYSVETLNGDQRDHMITYQITGLGRPTWLLFFEDTLGTRGADWDYNDLVVELGVVPAPSATLLGAMGVALALWVVRRAS